MLLCVLQVLVERQNELSRLEQKTRQLTEELNMAKGSSQTLKHTLEETEREKKVQILFAHIQIDIRHFKIAEQ